MRVKRRGANEPDQPVAVLRRMTAGVVSAQVLYTAVRLGIADRLAPGARSAARLARQMHVSPPALRRFMRMMVAMNLMVQTDASDRFGLSTLGQYLRADHPESLRARILYMGETTFRAASEMLYAVRTGKPAFDRAVGEPFFRHLQRRPDLRARFDEVLGADLAERVSGILAAYDFSKADVVVDVGGGGGALLTAILQAHPRMHGILVDAPAGARTARRQLRAAGMARRCRVVPADFFHDPLPAREDIYILSNVIHDWRDARAVSILRRCRRAMGPASRLLVIEEMMPDRASDGLSTVAADFSMLLLTGGLERTVSEYRALLGRAGLDVARRLPFEPARTYNGWRKRWAILECRRHAIGRRD